MQDQPVVGVAAEGLRDDLFQLGFDLVDGFARSEPGAVRNTEYVRVDREGLLAKGSVENDVRCLAADARQRLQLFPSARDLTAVVADQRLR